MAEPGCGRAIVRERAEDRHRLRSSPQSVVWAPGCRLATGVVRGLRLSVPRHRDSDDRPPSQDAMEIEFHQLDLRYQSLEPFQGERQVGAALGGDQGVDLVDDDGADGAERVAGARGEQQVERLGGRHQDVRRRALEAGALRGRGVAGADGDRGEVDGHAFGLGGSRDAGEGSAQVALHIHRQRLEGREVEHAAALSLGGRRLEEEAVDAAEEGGESLAGAGGGEEQRRLAARHGRPAEGLRSGSGGRRWRRTRLGWAGGRDRGRAWAWRAPARWVVA